MSVKAPRVNIVSWDGGGLGTDIDLLYEALLDEGCVVSFKARRHRRAPNRARSLMMTTGVILAQQWARVTGRTQFDLNLHIESIFPEYLEMAKINCIFVHPEWFRDENLPHIGKLDFVFGKTPSGADAFSGLPVTCRDMAFTSPDKRLPGYVRGSRLQCLHLAGQSAVKGSEAAVEAWSRHPEWPLLTVVRRERRYGGEPAPRLPDLPNVKYETGFVPAEELQRLQNECLVHVQPSQAEGYGHVIGEAMSCGAVVVTTDAAPMNELITPDRGVLVAVERWEPMRRSRKNFVDVGDLESQLSKVFALPPHAREQLGQAAREWFEAQHCRFRSNIRAFLAELPMLSRPKTRTTAAGRPSRPIRSENPRA